MFPTFKANVLLRQAVAYRQMSLLLRRPPGREAYPGESATQTFTLMMRHADDRTSVSSTFTLAFSNVPPR